MLRIKLFGLQNMFRQNFCGFNSVQNFFHFVSLFIGSLSLQTRVDNAFKPVLKVMRSTPCLKIKQ